MFTWRITKYNPNYRDEFGKYRKDEWTSYSDIGKIFNGYKVTKSDYLSVEDAYVEAIAFFMNSVKVTSLTVKCLEKKNKLEQALEVYPDEMITFFEALKEKDVLKISEIQYLARMVLREELWCKLENDEMFVHFGYDYYMYIGSFRLCKDSIEKIKKMGLFVEEYQSPYL